MYGTLQVIDVSDIEHPRSVAWYTPENGGVHNVWQVADTLYLGAYDAGFHVFDISGELKGDLRAQHREMASLNTADMGGMRAQRRLRLGRGGEPEGRPRVRERLQQRPVGGPRRSEEVEDAAHAVTRPAGGLRARGVMAAGRLVLLGGLVRLAGACASAAHGAARRSRPRRPRPSASGDSAGRSRGAPPDRDYRVFVASEGNDRIALVRFGPRGIAVERERKIGTNPTELAGPHGLYVSPDGRWYYVSTAHGTPNGALWKFSTETGEQAGRVELGRFPATLQVSPDGLYAYVVNFNLHGEMKPSSVSVVYVNAMAEVRAHHDMHGMPHGSRLNPKGTKHYSACMMDDMLVEIDARQLAVSRHFMLKRVRSMAGGGTTACGTRGRAGSGERGTCGARRGSAKAG